MTTRNEPASKTYFSTLDGMRGVAALLILIRHTPSFHGIVFPESYLAVDLFFLLSGVVIANAYEERLQAGLSSAQFCRLRLVRIYPLYILGSVLGVIAVLMGDKFEGSLLTATGLAILLLPRISGFSLFPLNPVSWSLFFEWVANLLYAFFHRFLTTRIILAIMLASALGLARAALGFGHVDLGAINGSYVAGFCRVSFSFFFGVLLWRRWHAGHGRWPCHHPNLVSLALIAIAAALLMAAPPRQLQALYDMVAVTLCFPALAFVALSPAPATRIVSVYRFLGVLSYGVYTLHFPIAAMLKLTATRLTGSAPSPAHPYSVQFGLAFMLALCAGVWLVDRYYDAPIRRWLLKSRANKAGSVNTATATDKPEIQRL